MERSGSDLIIEFSAIAWQCSVLLFCFSSWQYQKPVSNYQSAMFVQVVSACI